jgi:hypothetical protein
VSAYGECLKNLKDLSVLVLTLLQLRTFSSERLHLSSERAHQGHVMSLELRVLSPESVLAFLQLSRVRFHQGFVVSLHLQTLLPVLSLQGHFLSSELEVHSQGPLSQSGHFPESGHSPVWRRRTPRRRRCLVLATFGEVATLGS